MDIEIKEEQLLARMQRLKEMEAEILKKESTLKSREAAKKQILLRLSPSLWDNIAKWASDDFRSINSQVEYILTEAVRSRKKHNND